MSKKEGFKDAPPKREAYNCSLCQATFIRKRPYDDHLEKAHFNTIEGIDILSCDNCDFKTGNKPVFNKHIKYDKKSCRPDKEYFRCDYCDQLLVLDCWRKQHVKIFHADKLEGKTLVYTCAKCNYKVADADYFYKHKFECALVHKQSSSSGVEPPKPTPPPPPPDLGDRIEVIPITVPAIKRKPPTPKLETMIQVVPQHMIRKPQPTDPNMVKIIFGPAE